MLEAIKPKIEKVKLKNVKFACFLEGHGHVDMNETIEVVKDSKAYLDLIKAGWKDESIHHEKKEDKTI